MSGTLHVRVQKHHQLVVKLPSRPWLSNKVKGPKWEEFRLRS